MRKYVLTVLGFLFAFNLHAAITGTVMTPAGEPIAGAKVSLKAFETPMAKRERLVSPNPEAAILASAESDSKGRFTLDSPKEAVVYLSITASKRVPMQRPITRDEEVGAVILRDATPVTGRIRAGGKPVADAIVVGLYGLYEHVTKSDDQGRYELPDGKPTRLTVIHPDYAIDEVISTGSGFDLNRTLTAGTPLKGKTVAANGSTPIAGVKVFVDGWPLATSADDGTFATARVPARWKVIIASKDALIGQRTYSAETSQTIRMSAAATISGRIRDAKSGLPVPAAVVQAISRTPISLLPVAVSDAGGKYILNVPAGSYRLSIEHPAFGAGSAELTLAPPQQTSRDVSLQPLARITGVVVDEEKKPVAAARVVGEGEDEPSFARAFRGAAELERSVSGPDGRFVALHEATGKGVFVTATRRGLPSAKSEVFKLAPGERKSGIVLTIPSGIAVSGRVTDHDGNALSGVMVTPSESTEDDSGASRVILGLADRDEGVKTASDGTYTLRLSEGTYDFTFKRDGYAPKSVRAQRVTAQSTPPIDTILDRAVEIAGRIVRAGQGVDGVMILGAGLSTKTASDGSFTISGLTPGAVRFMIRKPEELIQEMRSFVAPAHDVVIDLPAGARVTGRVIDKDSRKAVTSFHAGVMSASSGGGMMRMASPILQPFATDDGSFVLEHVPPGAISLVIDAPAYSTGRKNLTVEEGKEIEGVEIELDRGLRITGRVTSPTGAPLSDVDVQPVQSSGARAAAMPGSFRGTKTDDTGEYSLDGLETTVEAVTFSHQNYASARKTVASDRRDQRIDVQLSAGRKISGVVVTDSDAPVADALVTAISNNGSMEQARTDSSGTFEIDSAEPGRYRFRAAKKGLSDGVLEDIDISAGTPIRIVLGAGGTIFGRVTGIDASDISNVMVTAFGNRIMKQTAVDPSGNYRIEGAPVGTITVSARVAGTNAFRTSKESTVELTAGGSQQVDLTFGGGFTIRGRVTRNGTPVTNGLVSFNPKAGSSGAEIVTDAEGRYEVSGLEEGDYFVRVADDRRIYPYSTSFRVSASATFDIDYRSAAVRGRVIDAATGDPLSNVTLQLRNTDPAQAMTSRMSARSAVTDASGAFAMDGVVPGAYILTATLDDFGGQTLDLNVGDSGVDAIELKLTRGEGVTLFIVDGRDGHALRGLAAVFDLQGRSIYEGRSVSETTEGMKLPLPAGTYSAYVNAYPYAGRNITFQSPSRQTVALTPGGTLILRSRHPQQERVRLIDASGAVYPHLVAGQWLMLNATPGATTLPNTAAGSYTIQLLGENDTVVDTKQVTIQEGQTVTIEM